MNQIMVEMKIITLKDLTGVGNGKLISKTTENDKNIFVWEVKTLLICTI